MMRRQIQLKFSLLLIMLLLLVLTLTASAQEIEGQLFISSSDASSAPTIILRAYGLDGQGNPLNLAAEPLLVEHGQQTLTDVQAVGDYEAGTFTLFLIDIPPGVEAQLPALQQAIEQYAAPTHMQERVDYLTIYRVGESEAGELLAPTHFHNAVRNFFATPPALQDGPTALFDSIVGMLNQMDTLKPEPDMYASLVVITDGTDVVSTANTAEDVAPRAAELGIPIHTIWLDNSNLQEVNKESGRAYLASLAAGSRGLPARLDQPAEVEAIWSRIDGFRRHAVLQYTVDGLAGGDYDVTLSLQNAPAVQAQTQVSVPANAPSVIINLPPESRELTLPNLEEPVELSFSTTVTWLDGIERALTSAELLVNGTPVQTIDVNTIDRFTASISNFNYGPNNVQVVVVDEQGRRATSPEISLTVLEGETQVPEDIQAGGAGSTLLRLAGGCLIVLLLLGLLALLAFATRRWRLLHRLGLAGMLRRIPFLRPYFSDVAEIQRAGRQVERYQREAERYLPAEQPPAQAAPQQDWSERPAVDDWAAAPYAGGGSGVYYLAILESVTRMPQRIDLTAAEHRIGRSPNQADIVFENDITVSRLHASLVLEGDRYRIYDEQSTSGTWVNEKPVTDYGHELNPGDEIRLGAVRILFQQD